MKRCPACRARINSPVDTCERCDCDLSMLAYIESQADYLLQRAIFAIKNEQLSEAAEALRSLGKLKSSPLAIALLNFVDASSSITNNLQCPNRNTNL